MLKHKYYSTQLLYYHYFTAPYPDYLVILTLLYSHHYSYFTIVSYHFITNFLVLLGGMAEYQYCGIKVMTVMCVASTRRTNTTADNVYK